MPRCPGQDQRFWKPDDIFETQCPHCDAAIEFWKDEPSLKCPECKKLVVNPKLDLGCAEWCQHAEQCLGAITDAEDILCKRLIAEMKKLFGRDDQKIDRSLRVFQNARQIQASEGGDGRLVAGAAILYGAATAQQDKDLSAVVDILFRCGVDSETAARIPEIITACHDQALHDAPESKILWDAVHLEEFTAGTSGSNPEHMADVIHQAFKTEKGRELARDKLGLGHAP